MSQTAGGEAASLPHPFFGKSIARCKVGERIGRGRTSSVCRAHYEPLGQDIALKILSGDLADQLQESFKAEAKAIAKLDHENIVRVLDVVEDQGCTCILMEYVKGDTLQDLLNDKQVLSPARALRTALQMARALEAAHAEKVIHRDVKPGNVMLADAGNTVKMVDFGLAGQKTLANRAGTPLYMSPEACQGKRIDEKSDIYALGICLYQMLTGKLPYTGKTVKEILQAHVQADFVPPSKVRPQLGDKYDDLLKKLLVASKGYRPTASEAVALLEPLVAESTPGQARGQARATPGGRRRARAAAAPRSGGLPPAAIAAIVGGVVIALVLIVVLSRGDDDGDAGKKPAAEPVKTAGSVSSTDTESRKPVGEPLDQQGYDKAYTSAKEALAEKNWKQAITAWEWFLEMFPDSELVPKAQKHLETAKSAEEQFARDEEVRAAAAEREAKAIEDRKKLDEKIRLLDFQGAEFLARSQGPTAGESRGDWKLKKRRLEFLAEQFIERMNGALEANEPSAQLIRPKAPDPATLVGATPQGLVMAEVSLKTTIPWEEVATSYETFYDLCRNLFSVRSVEDQLFMAIVCTELGMENEAKRHRGGVEVLDPDARRTLETYFD